MSNGAVYIITQDPRYVGLLLTSVVSLKRAMPELPVTVFSQFPIESKLIDRVIPVEPTRHGFYDKAVLMRQSPYERTLFVDADTHVVEAVPELFSLLDRFDCAATHEEYVDTDWHNQYPRLDIPSAFPEFNTGIMALRCSEKMNRVLESWAELYKSYLNELPADRLHSHQINDQPFFRAAAYSSDIRIATLPREYNCKFRGQGYLNGPVKILHGHIKFQLTPEMVKSAIRVLNASTGPRVYIAGRVYEQKLVGRLVSRRTARKVGSFAELPGSLMLMRAMRLKEVIKEHGLRSTLARVFANSAARASNKTIRAQTANRP